MFCGYNDGGQNHMDTHTLSGALAGVQLASGVTVAPTGVNHQMADEESARLAHIIRMEDVQRNEQRQRHESQTSSSNEQSMSINEHLSSMPMPWLDAHFRAQHESDMLHVGMGVLGPPQQSSEQTKSVTSPAHHRIGQQRCDGSSSSGMSSSNSSTSCSPTTTSSRDAVIRRQSSGADNDIARNVDAVVAAAMDGMKTEPNDIGYMHAAMTHHRHPSQPMPLHLAFGRCSEGGGGVVSDNLPAPARRTRSASDGMLKCQFCPKKWVNERALHNHMSDCRMIRSHECAQCGKRFKARGGLQQHMRIHSNDKPYACHFCSKRFTQKSHVDQHERIHTGIKPFTCQFCGRAFRQRSQQLGHEATHANHPSNAASASASASTSSGGARSEDVSNTSPGDNGSPRGVNNQATIGGLGMAAAAAAMMQQHQMAINPDILGQLEHTRGMMDGLCPDQLLALSTPSHMPNPTTISSLLALSGQNSSVSQQMSQEMMQQQHMHHHLTGGEFPANMPHAVGLINGLH